MIYLNNQPTLAKCNFSCRIILDREVIKLKNNIKSNKNKSAWIQDINKNTIEFQTIGVRISMMFS